MLTLSNHEVAGVQGFDVRQTIGGAQNEDTIDGRDGLQRDLGSPACSAR